MHMQSARPHWEKLFTTSPKVLKSLYPKLPDFIEVLHEFDPQGKFRNDYLERNIFSSKLSANPNFKFQMLFPNQQ